VLLSKRRFINNNILSEFEGSARRGQGFAEMSGGRGGASLQGGAENNSGFPRHDYFG
jgi:hypothetical protein